MLLRLRIHTIAAVLSCVFLSQTQASVPDPPTTRLLQAEESLSAEARNRITSVRAANTLWCGYLDKEGVLWFGSNDGVFRYDGMTFTNFSTKDGLCDNQVFSIIEDKDGFLWFGTANGLCRYDRTSFHHVPIPWSDISGPWLDTVYPIVNPNQVMCMLQDRRGDIWLGTNGAGAYRYDGETFVSYLANEGQEYSEGIHWNIIHSILEDSAGNIWFTSISHAGVSRFDGETFTHYSVKDGLSDDMVRSSYQDRKGTIWFGTHGQYSNSDNQSGGLDYFDGKSFGQLSQRDGLLRGHVMSMYEDKNGLLWLGRGVGAMCVYDGTSFAPFVTEGGKTFSGVMFIFEDAEGNVWFGGKEGKLLRYDGESVDDYSRPGG